MALDNPEDEVSPLWKVAVIDGKYRLCPYLACDRPGQCDGFRRSGAAACYTCGYQDGLEDGYVYGYEDGRNDPDLESLMNDAALEQDMRTGGMD